MKTDIAISPGQITKQTRIIRNSDMYLPYTCAYVDAYTYCINMHIDNSLEFTAKDNKFFYNMQIGKYNSIGANLMCVFARNHNYKTIDTGALSLMLPEKNGQEFSFNNKGNIVIQNDVWFGENVTVMGGVIIRNGAVIARNSHVVTDVPPYAIVGGNPARIIRYRFTKKQIDMLQKISWWDWKVEKLIENAEYFTENIEHFCDVFYEKANHEFEKFVSQRMLSDDSYFAFVDFYENYSSYLSVLRNFIKIYESEKNKKLILFIRDDHEEERIDGTLYDNLKELIDEINHISTISCRIELRNGNFDDARHCFLNCSHYIVSRTYDTVFFTCLADKLGIEIISGVDSTVQFH